MSHTNRIILLIDMDCFYCQVEENLDPNLKGKPLAVVQYNQWRGGGIIAVNYPARDKGVTRHMRGDDAKEKCPEIILAKVPEVRGKADLSKYRDAGKRVADVLQTFTPYLERASVDEAYLDITGVVEKRIQENNCEITVDKLLNTFVVGNSTTDYAENVTRHREYDEANFKLALGGVIAEEIRAEVFKVTGYRCSAGVAHNKILAKLVCGLHKPNKQTILPHEAVPQLYEDMHIKKITSLGGKFGSSVVEKLGIEFMGELSKFSQKDLAKKFDEKSGSWLYNIARGIDTEPVNTRLISKSIGCSKKFPGKGALCQKEDVEHWLKELAEEMSERLEKDLEENGRKARQMVVNFAQEIDGEEIHSSKSHPLNTYEQKRIFENAYKIVQKNCMKDDGSYRIVFLGISIGNFQDVKKVKEITSFFRNMRGDPKKSVEKTNISKNTELEKEMVTNTLNIQTEKEAMEISSDHSVYSRTTEEGDNDLDTDLIYYEQVHPESIANQNFITNSSETTNIDHDSDISHDSLSNEVNFEDNNQTRLQDTNSFFSKYFSGNLNRNFNTSKTLDDTYDSGVNNDTPLELSDIEQEISNVSSDIVTKEQTSIDNVCSQCGKVVNVIDYQSHLDYHFAISMVKNEAHLYKSDVSSTQSTPKKNSCGKKRKVGTSASSSHKSIVDYFKNPIKDVKENEVKEICSECNKLIPISDWDVHMDYHAAKKLHLEMNGTQSKPVVEKKVARSGKNLLGFLKST